MKTRREGRSPLKSGATIWQKPVWFPTSPLRALHTKLPNAKIDFDPGTDPKSTANLAKSADLAIVFAYQWLSEDIDVPGLSLPNNQEALIEQVTSANPRTIIVLEAGTAVTIPWIDKVAGEPLCFGSVLRSLSVFIVQFSPGDLTMKLPDIRTMFATASYEASMLHFSSWDRVAIQDKIQFTSFPNPAFAAVFRGSAIFASLYAGNDVDDCVRSGDGQGP
jgi:hypothetical protein